MTNNVIMFPKGKLGSPPQSIEELHENIKDVRSEQIEYLMNDILPYLFMKLSEEGFDLNCEQCEKPTMFFIEAFRSALQCSVNIDHPFQEMAEEIVCELSDEEVKEQTDDTA